MTNDTVFRPSRDARRLLFTLPGETPRSDAGRAREEESPQSIVANARNRHACFYRLANTEETYLMDDLILARAALEKTSSVPAENLDPMICEQILRAIESLEKVVVVLAEGVRDCRAFSMLAAAARAELEHSVLRIAFPGAEPYWTPPAVDDPPG